ncbi:uncharacterized protein LOC120270351 [Dioscorea cayenensis subsp. rotundata]|uniref:Uncharacterized protein LOC120270351 n=1 Tax=Dioscorea cayennensis subsp. rotundata TaxID=55577 RepID=A0AB40C0N8_DIOCR|nr:uncharacterized protein LOC120270351 [Dioscorea cayenensis subsp. rotundata]
MIDKIKNLCSRWKTYKLSSTAKSILINSSILSIPTYYLSAYPVPDSVLQEISSKSEGGLGLHNLSYAKTSLMAKNVFKYLNSDIIFWVDIARHKYGRLNFWTDHIPANCSWFFKGLCRTASTLKQNLWIKSFNPTQTSFLFDPWLFEIPLAFKPTYLNVNTDLNAYHLSDLIDNGQWNHGFLCLIFGNFLGPLIPCISAYDCERNSYWVWQPHSSNLKISSAIYYHLNHNSDSTMAWRGWDKLWKLYVAPRVKHFIWLMFHGRISTIDFLNSINIGPHTLCVFCNIESKSIDHIFLDSRCAQLVWNLLNYNLGINISFPDLISAGLWISDYNFSIHIVSVIAATIWFLWKARCDLIFNNIKPKFSNILSKVVIHVQEFM